MVQTLTGLDQFEEQVLRVPHDKIVVVDCAWTRLPTLTNVPNNRVSEFFAPKFDAIAEKYASDDAIAFYRIQILRSAWIMQQPYLISTPNTIFFQGGSYNEAAKRQPNWQDTSDLEKFIAAWVKEVHWLRDEMHKERENRQ